MCRGLVYLVSVLDYLCLHFSVSLQIITRGQLLTQQYLAPFLLNVRRCFNRVFTSFATHTYKVRLNTIPHAVFSVVIPRGEFHCA